MTTKDEALVALTKSRAGYKDFVKQVDADLRVEKAKRLAAHQGTIYHQVAEAWVLGATIEDLKRAYGTKDYKTIKNIIDNCAELPVQVDAPEQGDMIETNAKPNWYEIVKPPTKVDEGMLYVGELGYDIVPLDDGDDIMLVLSEGDDDLADLDGILESDTGFSDPARAELFRSIRKAMQ
jgi:hypothetical protein